MDITKTVGMALRDLREGQRLTQAELSARLQTHGLTSGSSAKTVSAWERGETPLPLTVLPILADALHMDFVTLTRSLGLCGDPSSRAIRHAEAAELAEQIDAALDAGAEQARSEAPRAIRRAE